MRTTLARLAAALGLALFGCSSSEPAPPPDNPLPVLLAADPDTVPIRSPATTIALTGQGFVSGSRARWNGSDIATTFVSATRLDIAADAARLAVSGPVALTVSNPTPGGGISGQVDLVVVYPAPTISQITPDRALVGSPALPLQVAGTSFVTESQVRINGFDVPTTYVNGTTLTATLGTVGLLFAGTAAVTVVNPTPGGGTSNARTLRIENPTPIITSISPDSVDSDAGPLDVTVVGQFVTGAQVAINGTPRASSTIAADRIRVQLSATEVAAAAPVTITLLNPEPAQGPSVGKTLKVGVAPPRINSVTPATVVVGSPGFQLALTGTNFGPTDQVMWNGTPLATGFGAATSLTATVPAGHLATVGPATITVRSGTTQRVSAAQVLPVLPAAPAGTGTIVVNQGAAALIADPVRNRLYAAVGASGPTNPNTVVMIDPATGAILGTIGVPGDPTSLALSDDARYLYVGLGASPNVARIDLTTGTRDLEIPLGQATFFGPLYAEDIVVLAGNPKAIAVSLYAKGVSPRHQGVAIFDEAVARPVRTQGHTGSNRITRGSEPTELFGANNETTEFGVRRLRVSATGLTEEVVRDGILSGFSTDLEFSGGYLFDTAGGVIEARRLQVVTSIAGSGLVAADVPRGRVHYFSGTTLSSHHYLAGAQIATLVVPGAAGAVAMARFGVGGIALASPTTIVLVGSSAVGPAAER
ncbi:MAG: IPT/TIG domain-containing protein [Gemmatimonadetes bacterium]|nr:IPT/TIG domain-containing protein [Gemmatimonadota bacterium]